MGEKVIAEVRYAPEHGENPILLSSVEEADRLIDSLLAGPADWNVAQMNSLERESRLIHDHMLTVGVDARRQVGLVSYLDEDGTFVTVGGGGSEPLVGYAFAGHHVDFEADSEIPLHLVRQAVKEFLVTRGIRPRCVQWQPQR
ncbi:Imm1 family immunity protein [Streptomyces sp. NPDC087440]|uniref:Imm1 family immunity protein n=1 Tax=Streptomyces sp. NPDC087440 TaxID=3365790 RepID=UPI0037FB4408